MGLLDSLGYGNQGGYGGLLDSLFYPSPLMKPQEAAAQPQYDPTGMPFAAAPQPDTPSPFPALPASNYAQFAARPGPAASPFNGGASPAPFAGPMTFAAGPTVAPNAPTQPAQAPDMSGQVNDINVGGYQMPRFGGAADFTPQGGPTDVSAQSRQPQAAQPQEQPQQPLPPAFGGGSALARIGSPDGLIARLTGNDSRSIAQQNLKAQHDALVPIVGPQKAMLAVMNPEAGKTILAQALEKKQYSFAKLDNDVVVNQDPQTGKVTKAYGDEASGVMVGPDGKSITMPAGADPKVWRHEITKINADVAAGKKTEVQAKAEIFGNKMEQSNKAITDGVGTSLAGKIASGLPLGNYIQSPEYQKYKQASSNFITALLRQESGAAISKTEFDRYEKEYMPQPGDSSEVLSQKTEARRVAIDGMKKGAGPGYKSPSAAPLPSGWSVSVR